MEWSVVQAALPGAMALGELRFAALMAFAVAGMPAWLLVRHALRRSKPEVNVDLHDEPFSHAA